MVVEYLNNMLGTNRDILMKKLIERVFGFAFMVY